MNNYWDPEQQSSQQQGKYFRQFIYVNEVNVFPATPCLYQGENSERQVGKFPQENQPPATPIVAIQGVIEASQADGCYMVFRHFSVKIQGSATDTYKIWLDAASRQRPYKLKKAPGSPTKWPYSVNVKNLHPEKLCADFRKKPGNNISSSAQPV
jgi:hypothetical protein